MSQSLNYGKHFGGSSSRLEREPSLAVRVALQLRFERGEKLRKAQAKKALALSLRTFSWDQRS